MKIEEIELTKIQANALQPRQEFDREKVQELANSIKEAGLLQPIVVRKKNGIYEIIAGERRFKAFNILNEKKIPAIVWDTTDETDVLEKSVIENLQRDDLSSIERENAIYELWKSGKYNSKAELSRKLGLVESSIRSYIEAKEFRDKTSPGDVSTKTIKSTIGLEEEERKEIIKEVVEGKLSPSRVEDEVRIRKIAKQDPVNVSKPSFRPSDFTVELASRTERVNDYLDNFDTKQGIEKFFSNAEKNSMIVHLGSMVKKAEEVIEILENVDDGV